MRVSTRQLDGLNSWLIVFDMQLLECACTFALIFHSFSVNALGLISVTDHVLKGQLRLMMQRDAGSPGETGGPKRWPVALVLALVGLQ